MLGSSTVGFEINYLGREAKLLIFISFSQRLNAVKSHVAVFLRVVLIGLTGVQRAFLPSPFLVALTMVPNQ
jgi:hypothetical protein